MVGDRHEHPRLKQFDGELNTAFPTIVEGRVALALWLDSLKDVNLIVVTHEIGHWVLKLQGFPAMIYPPDRHSNTEILLNSLIQHPPLYTLQKSIGHNPQAEVN